MTDEHRRESDPRIDELLDLHRAHVDEYHAFKKEELVVMVEEHKVNTESIPILLAAMEANDVAHERLLLVIEGTPVENLEGTVIAYDGGMRNDLADLRDRGNGGGGFSIRGRDKAQIALFTALIAAAASIVAAVIQ